MAKKLMVVTKKQVTKFIEDETKRLNLNYSELSGEVMIVLTDLRTFPIDNANQIKFYSRVFDELTRLMKK